MADTSPLEAASRITAHAAYGRLWRDWLRPHWPAIILVLIFMVFVAGATAGYAKFMEWVIGALEAMDFSVVWWGPLGVVGLTAVKGSAHYAQQVTQNNILTGLQARMQKHMFNRLVRMDLTHLLAESPAALAARFSADIELIRAAAGVVFGGLRDVMTLTAAIVVMLSIDWVMALVLIPVFFLAFGPMGIAGARIRRIAGDTQEEIANMTSTVNEGLSGIRMVRTYQIEERLEKSAAGVFDTLRSLRIRLVRWQALVTPMIEILAGIAIAILLLLVSLRIQAGAIDLAGFIGLITALGVATNPARKLGGAYTTGLQGLAALERVYALYDVRNDIEDGSRTFEPGAVTGHIEFRDVGFLYPDGFEALKHMNLEVRPGRTVAFVGRSGAGKTTVFNLLPRLFDATTGQIVLDGVPIRELTLENLRRQFSVVSQDSVLLSGTILENIGFGQAGITREACIAAARAAAADEFITALPDGYDTFIEPARAGFSGGERQRLSIARAILRDAPVLLLDEPTSALDARSESAIRAALAELSDGRTTLVIAHRLSTIMDADNIVVMDAGRIVDHGTHAELLGRGGLYADLYNLQFSMLANQNTGAPSRSLAGRQRHRGLLYRVAQFFSTAGSDTY
ncbi:MAG: ABC transporter ATP-binding protein [Rhodobacteraceae bacterium]|nr:ABC transporter ATP-binding protein [Paracoccaceae bacterium]